MGPIFVGGGAMAVDGDTTDFIPYELEHKERKKKRCRALERALNDTVPSIALSFDKDCFVLSTNDVAIYSQGNDDGTNVGKVCGKAIQCVNSYEEKGCGKEEPCSECILRKSIESTFQTGVGVYKLDCPMKTCDENGQEEDHLFWLTTTLKGTDVDKQVLVRLENVSAFKDAQDEFRERERMARIFKERAHLFDYANEHSLEELLEETLNVVEGLTESKIAFLHFVHSDQKSLSLQSWSKRTKEQFCKAEGVGAHYDIADAGVWVEAFHKKQPVIHNDYESMANKKALPKGHAQVVRELVVPVVRDEKVVALLGVGNKSSVYDTDDATLLARFADLAWDITERKRSSLHVAHLNSVLRAIRNINQLIVREKDPQQLLQLACQEMVDCRGANCVWIITQDEDGKPHTWAQSGCMDSFQALFELIEAKQWPQCRQKLIASNEPLLILDKDDVCHLCSSVKRPESEHVVIARMVHENELYGIMGLRLPADIDLDESEISLLKEVTGDIAFALWSISTEIEKNQLEEQLLHSQKMEAIGRLAGGIAHDFNNLLTIINSNADFVLSGLEDDKHLESDIKEIYEAGERAALLTKQLLAFSRQQIVDPRALDINLIIENLEKMLVRVIGEDIELKTSLAEDLGAIMAAPGQIEQVLMNLVVNARDAMPQGGNLRIKTSVDESDGKKAVVVSVTDTGNGIDKATLPHIFEPFFTTKGKGKGTGLGLSTAFGIIKQSKGEIRVKSSEGIGTTFEFSLPQVNALPENVPKAPKELFQKGTETILVVEDERILRGLCKRMIASAGYKVLVACDGEEAIALYKKYKDNIALILSDIVMPKLDGIGLAKALSELKAKSKVLYMSGYIGNPSVELNQANLTTDFIAKPFNRQTLLAKIREVLEGHK